MKSYIQNAWWMLIEKVVKLATTFILLGLIARVLGPEQFGTYSLFFSIVTLLWVVGGLGLDNILLKEFSQHPQESQQLFSTAFIIRTLCCAVLFITSGALVLFDCFSTLNAQQKTAALIFLSSLFFYNSATYYSYFQANSQSRTVAKISIIALIISSLVKLYLLIEDFGLIAFSVSHLIDIALNYVLLAALLKNEETKVRIAAFDRLVLRKVMHSAWPMLASNLIIIIYTRLDQFMIAKLLPASDLGVYSAAARIAEAYLFVPALVATSFYPMLARDNTRNTAKLYFDLILFSALGTGAMVTLLAPFVIPLLFGEQFNGAVPVLNIMILSTLFSVMGSACTNYMIINNRPYVRLIRTALGLLTNAILNIFLIPRFGIIGAAYATLISQIVASWLGNALTAKTRLCFKIQTHSIVTLGIPGATKVLGNLRHALSPS